MASVWGELKRRNVVKVAVAYAIVAWLLVQVVVSVEAPLRLPDWTDTLVIVFLSIGFVVAVFVAWAYELTPEGIKQTKSIPLSESVSKVTGRKLDFAIIAFLALALGFVVVDNYVMPESSESNVQTGDVLPSSIAVLPFENLSPNADDAFFAAGLHEEVLNQLAKLGDLSVISRTSVLRYTDSGLSIPEIARELNVGTVMEGSVRYASDRVRITLQLIDAETDEHLWSETYDRDFADIFAIETDIAMNIANAMEVEFSLEEQASIEQAATSSTEAYELYLRAISFVPNPIFGSQDEVSKARALLDQAIAIDPNFALAFVRRSGVHRGAGALRSRQQDLETAIELDSSLGFAYALAGELYGISWRFSDASVAHELAVESSPNDPEVLSRYAWVHSLRGEHAEAVRLASRAVELDPRNPLFLEWLAHAYLFSGDSSQASAALQQAIDIDPAYGPAYLTLGRIEAGRGNQAAAIDYLSQAETLIGNRGVGLLAYGYGLAGAQDDAARIEATRDYNEAGELGAMMALATGDV